jgi:hypothetical protein
MSWLGSVRGLMAVEPWRGVVLGGAALVSLGAWAVDAAWQANAGQPWTEVRPTQAGRAEQPQAGAPRDELRLAQVAQAQPPRTHVQTGALSGVQQKGVAAFLGIPYAAPPTGSNRWRAPLRAAGWKGSREATQLRPNSRR